MNISIKVEGLSGIQADLKAAGDSLAARRTERVLVGGARIIRDAWKSLAPVGETRNLQRAPVAKIGRRRGSFVASAIAAMDRRIAPHTHLVLEGTKAHEIKPKNAKALLLAVRSLWAGGSRFARRVRHPGAKPNPFTDLGVAANEGRVLDHVERGLGQLFDQVVKR